MHATSLFTTFVVATAVVALPGTGCKSIRPNPVHCANNEGDQYCAAVSPSRPFCELGVGECSLGGRTGCVAEPPLECHEPCGVLSDDDCYGTSSGGGTSGDTGGESTSGDASTSGSSGPGPDACMDECADETPLCVAGECVACTSQDATVCEDQLLVCSSTNECVPCTSHLECRSGACDIAAGTCFDPLDVVHVDGDADARADFTDISSALAAAEADATLVVVVHELDEGLPYVDSSVVDGGKTVAVVAAPGERPIVQGVRGMPGPPGLQVDGDDTTVYVHGLDFSLAGAEGVLVLGGRLDLRDSRVAQNLGGALRVGNGATAYLENCFLSTANNNEPALQIHGGSVELVYSSVAGGSGAGAAMECTGSVEVTARNSIFVAEASGSEVVCAGAMFETSAGEQSLRGGNAVVGPLDVAWFEDYDTGDLSLTAEGEAVFADAAVWLDGDPAFDINGDPRPAEDGSADYPGADVPGRKMGTSSENTGTGRTRSLR